MLVPRITPCLLLKGNGLVKGVCFDNHRYVGDPMNAIKIFNTKEADELILLDINATRENRIPSIPLIERIADECYMPFCVGGGIKSVDNIRQLLRGGVEKVSINTAAIEHPELIREASDVFGSQSIVVSIDVRKKWSGLYQIYTHCGTQPTQHDLFDYIRKIEKFGAGEILINSIDQDGTMAGYDLQLIKKVTEIVSIPVTACGGLGSLKDVQSVIFDANVSSAAGGSFFVFQGKKKAVLITYPSRSEINALLK
jgi:cyclase